MPSLPLLILVGLKSILSEVRIATPAFFFLLSICLVNLPPSLYFELMCVLAFEMSFLNTAYQWVLIFIQFASLCLLIGAFSPFTFKCNIVMCKFNPAILMLAGFLPIS